MWLIELGTICVTVAVVVRVWWLVVQVLRARNKRRLLSRMFGVVSDSPDFIGISAICYDIDSVSQVADLLDVEYASYELLVVMDARLKPELFREMLRHYRMMRVDYHPFEACSQLGVRGFYRSQTRGVNRLTLLDQMEAFSVISSDAAVRAASCKFCPVTSFRSSSDLVSNGARSTVWRWSWRFIRFTLYRSCGLP